ncbi:MAG: SDR family oxidoreductase [Acidimicrobiia bacterium]|nr:SDR family oxidoreductase [Acidimicrobiia bacterium]MDH4362958.1 SDR family oxidoreductase [Acidimicrobiia bacterium]
MTTEIGKELAGKVALITGGARPKGQGAAEGRLFAARGATVILADVIDEEGEATAGSIEGAEYVHLDVTSEESWDQVVDDIMARHGRLDILINNAGIARMGRLVNTTMEDWQTTMAVNQTGVFLGMRAAARAMIEAGNGGSIVNISSVAGMQGLFGSTAYGASKWAVRGMTKIAAKELGRHQIRVNSIHPGFIDTDMLNQAGALDDEQRAKMARSAPIGRIGVPEDIAGMAFYLVGPTSTWVTGQEFVVDGGWHG